MSKIAVLPTDRLFLVSPETGDPACLCSRCGQVCKTTPLRVFIPPSYEFPKGAEYRYHGRCVGVPEFDAQMALHDIYDALEYDSEEF